MLGCGETGILIQCWKECKMTKVLQSLETKQPKYNSFIHQPRDPISRNLPQTYTSNYKNILFTMIIHRSTYTLKDWKVFKCLSIGYRLNKL